MEEGYCNWTLIFCFLLVLGKNSCNARKIQEVDKENMAGFNRHVDVQMNKDPSLNVFFNPDDLTVGKTIPIFFPIKNHSQTPKLLPRELADALPFSVANLSYLLDFFSIPTDSPQAKAMAYTLTQCELEPMKGETKFCATSLESLLDSTRGFFGLDTRVKAVTTRYPKKFKTQLQNYTILKEPNRIWAPKILSCHTMPYPYFVFYCHSQMSDNMLYEVILGGENGERIKGVAICHLDTSEWDREHVVFRVLDVEPGASSVCHFYPADNIAWIPLSVG